MTALRRRGLYNEILLSHKKNEVLTFAAMWMNSLISVCLFVFSSVQYHNGAKLIPTRSNISTKFYIKIIIAWVCQEISRGKR